MIMGSKLLFVDDHWQEEQAHLANLPKEIEVTYEATGERALQHLKATPSIRTVLLDLQFDGQLKQGEQILNEIKEHFPEIPVIILTSMQSVELALRLCLREKKAYDYFVKSDIDADRFRICIENAIRRHELETDAFRRTDKGLILGNSSALEAALRLALRAANVDSTVLISGESGTGKELFARAIHLNSQRNGKPFLDINCGAIPSELIESELFGHERGAFTGAMDRRIGKIEAAHRGTLFLDEIGELAPAAQVKLLRVLQEREIRRVGDTTPINVDFRLIAATNRDLDAMVKEKTFREDLYYRINVIPIVLPPLRQRKEDIPTLAAHFIEKCNNENGSNRSLLPEAIETLQRYDWPGNIRELQNVIERSMVSSSPAKQLIGPEDLPALLSSPEAIGSQNPVELWVDKVFSGTAQWKELNAEFKVGSTMLREIWVGIIERWKTRHGDRPSGNELAKLIGTSRQNVNVIMNGMGLKFRDFDD
jgi:DNA-binding NtrC family response regulator